MTYISGYSKIDRNAFLGLDVPPEPANAMNDEFEEGSLDTGKWTWLDQGGTTASQSNGRLVLSLNENANRIRGIYQTAPTAPWAFEAAIYRPNGNNSNNASLLFSAENTTGEVRSVGVFGGNQWRTLTYATPASGVAAWEDSANYSALTPPRRGFVRLAYDGTSLVAGYCLSPTKHNWIYLGANAPGYTPTLIGLCISNVSNTAVTFPFGWFRRVI